MGEEIPYSKSISFFHRSAFVQNNSLPLSRFKVLDLTRARAGPTAVRQFADWGADVIKIEAPLSSGYADNMMNPRSGYEGAKSPPQQKRHDPQPARRKGPRDILPHGEGRRRRDRKLPARREAPPGGGLRGLSRGQPAHRLREHLRFRAGGGHTARGRGWTR